MLSSILYILQHNWIIMIEGLKRFSNIHPEENTGYLLWQVSMIWLRRLNSELEKVDLTHTQLVVLVFLGCLNEKGEAVTQIDISNQAKIDRMMTSKVLKTLQKKGLINRTEHLTDTRAKAVVITEQGIGKVIKASELVDAAEREFFGSIEENVELFNKSMITLLAESECFGVHCAGKKEELHE